VYDVKAGITSLGKDFGNGSFDAQVFQRDAQAPIYREAKRQAMRQPDQHMLRDGLSDKTEGVIAQWMARRLQTDCPDHFADVRVEGAGLDALAMLVQEDLAVLQLDEQGDNRLSYLNVCMPSGWPPEEKIGRPFDQVHAPVPHIEPISAKQHSIARLMINATRGAVRFAWTITTDSALNHQPRRDPSAGHPTPLPDHPAGEPLLRVERQVIWGFPDQQAALFLIRTYLYPFDSLESPVRGALAHAVSGMSDASLAYKNMDRGLIVGALS